MGIKHQVLCGSKIRAAKRNGNFHVLTRRQKVARMKAMTEPELKAVAADKENGAWIQRHAERRIVFLNRPSVVMDVAPETTRSEENEAITESQRDFAALVERFRKEGKTNPEASARASRARRAQIEKQKQAVA